MKKKLGRPRTRRSDLQVFAAQMTPEAKLRLQALARVERVAAYQVLEEAFWYRWKSLPEATRDRAEAIAELLEGAERAEAVGES